jgi:hypothetical protein
MVFDSDEEIQELAFEAVRSYGPAVTPIEATRKLAHDLVAWDHEFVMLSRRHELVHRNGSDE